MIKTIIDAKKEVNALVEKAQVALNEFLKLDQEKIDYIVAKCSVAGLDNHGILAKAAIDETGRGVFEDKATKNLFACEYVTNNMRSMKTVGVMGDGRTYDYAIALRSVSTEDFMTCTWTKIPYRVLDRVSSRIVNEVKGVNRVLYDITGKPPATVEYE